MTLPITLTIAAAAALLNLWLGFRIAQVRRARKVLHGDGGDALLIQRMRAQANFVENTPFMLILLALDEAARGTSGWLWGAGILYVLARIAHGFGMDSKAMSPLRGIGFVVTVIVLIGLAAYALDIVYMTPARSAPLVVAP